MKKLILLFLLLLPAVFFSFGSSCDSKGGDSEKGSFTVAGNTYPVHNAVIEAFGATNGSYPIGFEAASSGIDLIEYTGEGSGFFLYLYSPNSTLASGTYTYNTNLNPFTFDYAEIYTNWDFDAWDGTVYFADGGTVNVTVSGNTYTVEFTVSLIGGGTATGSYAGPAIIF